MNEERDVIGEVIAEDNARPIHPAVAEYAVAALHTATSDGERVAELELLNKELWRQNAQRDARIEEQAREIERLKAHGAKWLKRAENWSALKARPSGVLLPERLRQVLAFLDGSGELDGFGFGERPKHLGEFWWRTELRTALAELNLPTATATKCQTCQDSGVVSTTDKDHNGDHIEERCPDCAGEPCQAARGQCPGDGVSACKKCPEKAGGVDERAAFEAAFPTPDGVAWNGRSYGPTGNHSTAVFVGLCSVAARMDKMWEVWQARAALNAGSAVPDGKYAEVLTPFLSMMENELHANAGKGDRPGWLQMDRKTALLEIYYHLGKLQKAAKDNDLTGIVEYAADVANMSMMLVDVCGLLAAAPTAKKEG